MKQEERNKKPRILYLDILRDICIIGVMLIHFTAKTLGNPDVGEPKWGIFLALNCLGRSAVPVFFMISGSLFLAPNKQTSMKKLYFHNILHLFICLFFWSFLEAVWDLLEAFGENGVIGIAELKGMMSSIIMGPTHLWFLYVLIALYMIIPFLRMVASKRRNCEYYLILWFVFSIMYQFMLQLNISFISGLYEKFQMSLVCGYSGFFVLGYYLHVYCKYSFNLFKIISGMGLFAYCFTYWVTDWWCRKNGYYTETFLGYLSPNCVMMAITLFVTVKQAGNCIQNERVENRIHKIAQNSFGIYLMHNLVFTVIRKSGIIDLLGNGAWEVPLVLLTVYLISYYLTKWISKIPIIGKWIV